MSGHQGSWKWVPEAGIELDGVWVPHQLLEDIRDGGVPANRPVPSAEVVQALEKHCLVIKTSRGLMPRQELWDFITELEKNYPDKPGTAPPPVTFPKLVQRGLESMVSALDVTVEAAADKLDSYQRERIARLVRGDSTPVAVSVKLHISPGTRLHIWPEGAAQPTVVGPAESFVPAFVPVGATLVTEVVRHELEEPVRSVEVSLDVAGGTQLHVRKGSRTASVSGEGEFPKVSVPAGATLVTRLEPQDDVDYSDRDVYGRPADEEPADWELPRRDRKFWERACRAAEAGTLQETFAGLVQAASELGGSFMTGLLGSLEPAQRGTLRDSLSYLDRQPLQPLYLPEIVQFAPPQYILIWRDESGIDYELGADFDTLVGEGHRRRTAFLVCEARKSGNFAAVLVAREKRS